MTSSTPGSAAPLRAEWHMVYQRLFDHGAAVDARAQDASDNAAELARMKKDTTSRTDDQLS